MSCDLQLELLQLHAALKLKLKLELGLELGLLCLMKWQQGSVMKWELGFQGLKKIRLGLRFGCVSVRREVNPDSCESVGFQLASIMLTSEEKKG